MEWIYKKIWELKTKALTLENKKRIQKLQQLLDKRRNESQKDSTSEKISKNNSAKNNSNIEEDIESFLFNRYNR